jgi:hypothetical protein
MSWDEARLTAFDQHKDNLLRHFQNVCKPKTRAFDPNQVWSSLKFWAWQYLLDEARANKERMRTLAAVRIARLRHLGKILKEAHRALDEAKHYDDSALFGEWCELEGLRGSTDDGVYESIFAELFKYLIVQLAKLETATSRAAEQVRQKPGRPGRMQARQTRLIVSLEHVYRRTTGKHGPAGRGPFAQFVTEFLDALGCPTTEGNVIQMIKTAKNSGWREW